MKSNIIKNIILFGSITAMCLSFAACKNTPKPATEEVTEAVSEVSSGASSETEDENIKALKEAIQPTEEEGKYRFTGKLSSVSDVEILITSEKGADIKFELSGEEKIDDIVSGNDVAVTLELSENVTAENIASLKDVKLLSVEKL
ncbi:MAG: hypothetical protein IJS61_10760 [Firmicutes bacterium]|nr:hypothetical protein [Bacillota bacterium]